MANTAYANHGRPIKLTPRRIARKYNADGGTGSARGAGLGDRPREKLCRNGTPALTDQELLALVLGHGTRKRGAMELSAEILALTDGLHGMARASVDHLQQTGGVGQAVAARLVAAIELGRRTLMQPPEPRPRLLRPRDVAAYLMPAFGASSVERFGVMLFDVRCQLMRVRLLTVGSTDAVTAEPRDVFREALLGGASAVVAFHNHPSGDLQPSGHDITLTRRMIRMGRVLGITVLDHMIIGDTRYFSMKEQVPNLIK